jgi:hypothetical protein
MNDFPGVRPKEVIQINTAWWALFPSFTLEPGRSSCEVGCVVIKLVYLVLVRYLRDYGYDG